MFYVYALFPFRVICFSYFSRTRDACKNCREEATSREREREGERYEESRNRNEAVAAAALMQHHELVFSAPNTRQRERET